MVDQVVDTIHEPEDVITHQVQVHFGGFHDNPGVPMVDYIAPPRESFVVVDIDPGVTVSPRPPDLPTWPEVTPDVPMETVEELEELWISQSYNLHPSLLRKKKKRKISF